MADIVVLDEVQELLDGAWTESAEDAEMFEVYDFRCETGGGSNDGHT
ncbi:hypothetical protein [Micromonospora sp. NPDC050276]